MITLLTGSLSGYPFFLFGSNACLFKILCINMLLLPRLLHLFKKFPARLTPAFPTTVPTADAATYDLPRFKGHECIENSILFLYRYEILSDPDRNEL